MGLHSVFFFLSGFLAFYEFFSEPLLTWFFGNRCDFLA